MNMVDKNMNAKCKCSKLKKNVFTIDILGGVRNPRSTKHTSCSHNFPYCCLSLSSLFFI